MNRKWIKEKHRYNIPVVKSEAKKGQWKNVTRDQVVNVINVYPQTIEYEWQVCPIGKIYYIKSIEHFLRSYTKI